MNVVESAAPAPMSANDLAVRRSLMAADRTLMAWVRTALSMYGFGFTIYKILQAVQAEGSKPLPSPHTPRNVGMFLAALGTFAVVMGTIEYWQNVKEMSGQAHVRLARPSLIMAVLMSLFGALLFTSIIGRMF